MFWQKLREEPHVAGRDPHGAAGFDLECDGTPEFRSRGDFWVESRWHSGEMKMHGIKHAPIMD